MSTPSEPAPRPRDVVLPRAAAEASVRRSAETAGRAVGGGVDRLVAEVRRELAGELRARVRVRLLGQPVEWLVEQLLDLALPYAETANPAPHAAPLGDADTTAPIPAPVREEHGESAAEESRIQGSGVGESGAEERRIQGSGVGESGVEQAGEEGDGECGVRAARVRELCLDEQTLGALAERYSALDRAALRECGLLVDPPAKGGPLLGPAHRSPEGEELLGEVKDVLHALLFCGPGEGVMLDRVQRELLTLTVPRAKAHAVAFLTPAGAEGTWGDPGPRAHDDRAPNALLQVEYGETANGLVGHGLVAALRLINELEINEQVLYARMEDAEQSPPPTDGGEAVARA
ncbi:hypothetical protein AB0L05_29835 [Nonomuraea pusilla]|uniref:hypothetical protein n=1 Tax=Nonomuraea pusilla TaxID=46177 RepID=UPI00331EB4D1